jgi:transposase
MMVALLLYACARATRSSRAIERDCEEDVAFRVLAAQQRPDHATIARFVDRHREAMRPSRTASSSRPRKVQTTLPG